MLHDRSDVKDARGQTKIRNQRATLRRLSVEIDVMRKALQTMAMDEARERVAAAMIKCSLATGHGDTIEDLLAEMVAQVIELQNRLAAAAN